MAIADVLDFAVSLAGVLVDAASLIAGVIVDIVILVASVCGLFVVFWIEWIGYQREREQVRLREHTRVCDEAMQRGIENVNLRLEEFRQSLFRKDEPKYDTFDDTSIMLAKAILDNDKTAARAILDYLNEHPELLGATSEGVP